MVKSNTHVKQRRHQTVAELNHPSHVDGVVPFRGNRGGGLNYLHGVQQESC